VNAVRHNWQALNELRSYPIEEAASKLSDSGQRLPDDVLVTAKLAFPGGMGARACLSGLTVGPGLVTATFVATNDAFEVPKPLCAISVPKSSLIVHHPYHVQPHATGVAGWVAFGNGVNRISELTSWRFSDASRVPIIKQQARPYKAMPLPAISRQYGSSKLSGLIGLRGMGDLVIETGVRTIGGQSRRCIIFRLNRTARPTVLADYLGPYGVLPESRTCNFPPIRYINDVEPDAQGNINITADEPLFVIQDEPSSKVELMFPESMTEVCERLKAATDPSPDGTWPDEGDDIVGEEE